MSSHRPGAPDLPVEILTEIFRLASPDHAERFRWKDSMYWDEDLANPSLTPNSLCSVCKMWDIVLGGEPEFWTKIVVHLDHFRYFDYLQLALERSRPNYVKSLTILNSTASGEVDEAEERAKLEHIFALLSSQSEDRARIRSLAVRTRWSGSLPNAMIRPWAGLGTLKLESEKHSQEHLPSPASAPITGLPFPLSVLGLTGPMFVKLWRSKDGKKAMKNAYLLSFTVCCARARDGGEREPLTFHELAEAAFAFGGVQVTNFVNIDFPVEDLAFPASGSFYGRLQFQAIPIRLLIHFIDDVWRRPQHSDIGSLKIHLCTEMSTSDRTTLQGNVNAGRIGVLDLDVADISEPTDLLLLWKRIDAKAVTVRQCPGFTDEVLSSIADGRSSLLKRVDTLDIVGCLHYSPHRLQALFGSKRGVSVNVGEDKTTITWQRESFYGVEYDSDS